MRCERRYQADEAHSPVSQPSLHPRDEIRVAVPGMLNLAALRCTPIGARLVKRLAGFETGERIGPGEGSRECVQRETWAA